MTAETTTVSLDALDAALAAAAGRPGADEQRLAAAVLRLLAAGEPARIPAAAAAAGIPEPAAGQALRSWPAVFWDGQGRVTGFRGLALAGMPPHRIRHARADLSAWCAFDPLFLALVIGDLQAATADPVTCEAITIRRVLRTLKIPLAQRHRVGGALLTPVSPRSRLAPLGV